MGKDIDEINTFLDEHEKKKEIPKQEFTQPMLHRKELRKFALTDEEIKELEDGSK